MHAIAERSERRRFVPLEFNTLLDSGFFRPDERVWLQDGQIMDGTIGGYRRFTTRDLERMSDLGFFDGDNADEIELLEGEILAMARPRPRHSWCIDQISRKLHRELADRARVRVQMPIFLDDEDQPVPDLAIVTLKSDGYRSAHPVPAEVHCLIEVMDTSHHRDRILKLPRYASTGVREVWLVDLPGREIEICRDPSGSQYLDRRVLNPGQTVSPAAFPDVVLPVDDFIGS